MKTVKQNFSLAVAALALAPLLSSCNLLGWIDSPSSDEALLSAARGCFDAGDYDCAKRNYEALSNDQADIKTAEQIYVTLEEEGAGFGTFLKAILGSASGGGSPGALVRDLANELAVADPGEAKRNRLVAALLQIDGISSEGLKGFTRFLVSTSLFAELLAEVAGTNQTIDASDVAAGDTSCATSTCGVEAACDKPADGGFLTTGSTETADIVAEGSLTGDPSIRMLNGVIAELNASLSEMGATGGYSQASTEIADQLSSVDPDLADDAYSSCIVQTLFSLGIVD